MQLLTYLLILPTAILAIPLSDFFDYNRTRNICNSRSGRVNDDLRRGDCDTVLFPRETDSNLLYNLNITFPFFNERVSTINVSNLPTFMS